MKYGSGYTLITRTTGFLSRTLFYFRRTELNCMLDLLKNEKGKKILDYGCNSGYFTNMIKNKVPNNEVCGADINIHALDYARNKYKHLKFYQASDEFFQKNKFDIIIVSHVLEHIKEREEFMKNLSNIISDNGKIIIAVPQERIRGDSTIVQLLYNFLRLRFENPHVVKLDYNDLNDLFGKIGFKIDKKIYTNYFLPVMSKSRKINSWSLIVCASKV